MSNPSPERGAIRALIESKFHAFSTSEPGHQHNPQTCKRCAAESELAALEAEVEALKSRYVIDTVSLTAVVDDLRAELAAAEEDKSLKESAYVQMRAERDYWVGLCRAKKDDVQALMDRLNRIAESE